MMSPETNTILNSLVERLHVEVEDDLMGRRGTRAGASVTAGPRVPRSTRASSR